jgi:hypothetical protein
LQEGGKLNKRQLMEEALTESRSERKLSKLSKTMDYFERAKREKERALLLEAFKQRQQDDEVYYNQQQEVGAQTLFLHQDASVPLFCMSSRCFIAFVLHVVLCLSTKFLRVPNEPW